MIRHLECENLVMAFNGFRAVNDVSLEVRKDEIRAIIGPNGAGKSTLFNLLTGFHVPASGRIVYKDVDITRYPAFRRIKMGFSRSFQAPKIFQDLTVRRNVEMALQAYHSRPFEWNVFKFRSLDLPGKTEGLLRTFDFARHAEQFAGSLSHGDQRILEICMAMALDPEILLLDEPTSGMSEHETQKTIDLLMKIYAEDPITMVIIEHDMRVVRRISHRITVLHQGSLLAEGMYEEVEANERVQKAFFGEVR
ncbi:MAG: ABC transporter ATP-binding protein [Deltaproteobacteria bacterium]|nr:ABC transporter ATP-binding protein [Deltaproteobacteria bacterium]